MIAKGHVLTSVKAVLNYGYDLKKNAQMVLRNNLYGSNIDEITKEFKMIHRLNNRCKKNMYSFIISPHKSDGEKLSNKDFNKIAVDFLEAHNLQNHQAIAFTHHNTNNPHMHIYASKIGFDGQSHNDSFIGSKSMKIAEEIAIKYRFKTTRGLREQSFDNTREIRKEIKMFHDSIMKQRPKSVDDYIKKMKNNNVIVKPVINKQNKLQGFRYEYNGRSFKGSEVHRDMSVNKLNFEAPGEQKMELSSSKEQFNFNNLLFDYSGEYEPNRNKKRKNTWQR